MSGIFQNVLVWIYGWVGNYGWSVVVFTLLVRLIVLPLDIKSRKSMRAMTKVQPKVQALQKKYANDQEKLNRKLQELYKAEHVSPLAGCLPMLISLPILWWMFGAMRNLANEQTIQMILQIRDTGTVPALQGWLWIKNVFQPDSFTATILPQVGDQLRMVMPVNGSAILTEANIAAAREFLTTDAYAAIVTAYGGNQFIALPLNLVFFNPTLMIPNSLDSLIHHANGLFLLPIFAAVSQFLMTKFTGAAAPQADEAGTQDNSAANAMNNGFMKWFFPLFSLWICAGYNAAFAIYWMAANVIMIVQQLALNWYFDRKDKQEAMKAQEANEIK